jgi:hypothetical protein
MKTLLKLLLAAAVLNATWRIGTAYWNHYQFEDAVKELAEFSDRTRPEDVTAKVLDLADKMDVPLQSDELKVDKAAHRTTIDAVYFRDIEVFPRVSRHWEFDVHVSVIDVN